MRLLDFQPAPLLLGFVLGPLMEENLRRALLISRGDFMVFLERPISGCIRNISRSWCWPMPASTVKDLKGKGVTTQQRGNTGEAITGIS
jgi:TctA family transporter